MNNPFGPLKLVSLTQKYQSIEAEFADWRARSEKKDDLFAKHHSQIRRIQSRLSVLCSPIGDTLENATGDSALTAGSSVERQVLAAYRIWEYFRAKLLQREGRLAPFLKAADEFAWHCYRPARKAFFLDPYDARRKEPPLVFFNGRHSPFAISREQEFRVEHVAGEPLVGPVLEEILKQLPVPVVGVPWYQAAHLPDALVIGHEVGHLVEADFGLDAAITAALNNAKLPAARQPAWESWLGEVFADVYGCLATGPAYAAALINFLVTDSDTLKVQSRIDPKWGKYPTPALRVKLNLQVLKGMGLQKQVKNLEERWNTSYPTHAMSAYDEDLEPLTTSLLAGPYPTLGGKKLTDILTFTESQHAEALQAVNEIVGNGTPSTHDVRALFAALRLLFKRAPADFASLGEKLLKHIVESSETGLRSRSVAWSTAANETEKNALQAGDIELGKELRRIAMDAIAASPDED